MPPEVYTRREMRSVVPSESPIEERMAEILEDGLGSDCRAIFMKAASVVDAEVQLAECPDLSRRYPVIVFPQPTVGRHRPDFLVIVTAPGVDPAQVTWTDRAFLLECDGEEFHGAPKQIRADASREKELRRLTGLEVVRFSGAEINFAMGFVIELLETIAELRASIQSHPQIGGTEYCEAVRRRLSKATSLPALRRQHVGRNSQCKPDPYDPMDPRGELFRQERHQAGEDLDGLDEIVAGRAEIRHEVARARREWMASDAAWREEEPDGGLILFDYALTAAIEQAAERFFACV